MKKFIIAAIVFLVCQSITLGILSGMDSNSTTDEVDMEIYEFEHEGHEFLIFEEYERTVSVIHDPNCKCGTIK